jgi:hypothetical protein
MKKLFIIHVLAVAIIILAGVQLLNGSAYATSVYPDCFGYCECGSGDVICNGVPGCYSAENDKFRCTYFGELMTCLHFCCDHQPCYSK